MGDRGNIVIRTDHPKDIGPREAVFLYSHWWGGTELPQILRDALAAEGAQDRWNDAQYHAMTRHDDGGTTGYGITTRLYDNEWDLIVLEPDEQRIMRLPERDYRAAGFLNVDGQHATISFADYIAAETRDWDGLCAGATENSARP